MATVLEQSNPLREGLRISRIPDPCAFVVFGITGDLGHRKIMPSIFRLWQARLLPQGFTLLGMASSQISNEEFREKMRQAVEDHGEVGPINGSVWDAFAENIFYTPGDFQDASCYDDLKARLAQFERERGTDGNAVFYLSTPPSFFGVITRFLGEKGMAHRDAKERGWTRLIVEKPFGHDLQSAIELNKLVADVFDEEQVYRIDHYLGKDTVQNLLILRFANTIFEPIWNRRYIDHIEITIAETLGVEERGRYYEEAGAVRDMIQNHGLQLLSLVAMEPPAVFDSQSVRDEKAKVFRSVRQVPPDEIDQMAVRGQYGPGTIAGKPVPGYRQEDYVDPNSTTETYAALKLLIDNWRWQDVPFYIRTGKRLARRVTEIAIQFKTVPHLFFQPTPVDELAPNALVIRIQPDEGASLKLESKLPGLSLRLRPVAMDFRYLTSFGAAATEAYDRLLLDCMLGDSTLFARRDGVELAWEIVDPILNAWEKTPPTNFPNYASGSWGPQEAEEMLRRDGRHWRRL